MCYSLIITSQPDISGHKDGFLSFQRLTEFTSSGIITTLYQLKRRNKTAKRMNHKLNKELATAAKKFLIVLHLILILRVNYPSLSNGHKEPQVA